MRIDLSVLILAYNKGNELPLTLRGFELQKNDVKRWELVIVDDGSTDNTATVIKSYQTSLPIRLLRIKHTGNRNLNRNFGINRCRGKRIVYIDGDIVPTRHFLKNHNSYSEEPVVALGSRLGMVRSFTEEERNFLLQGENLFILETIPGFDDMREMFLWVDKNMINAPSRWMLMHSHNFSMPLSLLKEIGCFEERLIYWGADDLELGYRFVRRNLRFVYDRSLGGIHLYHPASVSPECEANVTEFYNIHKDEAVEFLYMANFMNHPELIKALSHCRKNELTVEIKNAAALKALNLHPGDTILNCVTIRSGKDGLFPRMEKLGIYSRAMGVAGYYENVVLSHKLMNMGESAFVNILKNMSFVAKRVYIYDPKKAIKDSLKTICTYNAKREFRWKNGFWQYAYNASTAKLNIHFSAQALDDRLLRNYALKLLGVNLRKMNMVSNVLFKTEMDRKNVTDRFLKIDVKEEVSSYFLSDDRTFVFLEEWEVDQWKSRYHNLVAVFWNELPGASEEKLIALEKKFDILIFNNKRECHRYRQASKKPKPNFVIEPFVNTRVFHPSGARKKNKVFTITIIKKAKDIASRDDLLLKAITEEFCHQEDIRIEIYFGKECRIDYYNPYVNESFNAVLTGRTNANAILNGGIVDNLIRPYKNKDRYGNISIIDKDLSEQELAGILRRSDVNICLSLPCLAAMSVACATETVTQDVNKKYAFLNSQLIPEELVTFISTRVTSDYLSRRSVQKQDDLLDIDLAPSLQIDWDELKSVLRSKYNAWRRHGAAKRNGRKMARWLKENSVDRACEKIIAFFTAYR
jgi:glycosyltransferase involved in cell wall biosynthesis